MTAGLQTSGMAEGIVEAVQGEQIVLRVPHSDYRLHLRAEGTGAASLSKGRRVRGIVGARALRIHRASGGGSFIEPAIGAPRIVAGMVLEIEAAARRVLILAAIPVWLHFNDMQSLDVLRLGGLVNCHVESGAWITLDSA